MKNFTFLAFTALLLFCFTAIRAQKHTNAEQPERCGTMKNLAVWQAENPLRVAESQRMLEQLRTNPPTQGSGSRLQAIVTIPVVFHIVLPNPFVVTDADCQAQIDRLNLDYSGLNPDSTNAGAFLPLRGHSQIRFVLAKRTPAGQPTNGIERRTSSTIYTGGTNDPIKNAAAGGLAVWDFTQYFNIWVGTGGGLLGYATFPGTSNASQQGVVTDIVGTAANPCYVDPNYNLGRTLTHEAGHYFGLLHIWGDEAGCANSDFRNIPGSTCPITDPTLAGTATDQTIGDTPNQGDENFGCPTGVLANSCGSPNGDMYQNYMDYTNDACMTLFTIKQAARMEWVVNNCRSGYLTTLGGTPPATGNNWDAAPAASVNPGGFELSGCAVIAYTDAFSCAGNLAPKFRVQNLGLNTITSLTVGYRLNNGTAVTQNVTVNIPTGGYYIASFPSTPVPVGNHIFKFFTAQPNGNADQVPANDTIQQAFRVMPLATVPFFEGFESNPPFPNFAIDNYNGDATWTRTSPGRTGNGKLSMNNYDVDNTGTFDDLRSSAITVNPASSYTLTFDVAHKFYPLTGAHDTLSVFVSTNCGQTYTRIYQKWGATLAGTAGQSTAPYTTPAAGDWRTESLTLTGAQLASGQIVIVFRNSGRYGNYIHLDNINISSLARDLRLVSINNPGATSCGANITPNVTVANDGSETVTSFKVGYRFDNGANNIQTFNTPLAPGASVNITLPAGVTTSGAHTFWAFTADPVSASGTGDLKTSNDTLSKAFTVVALRSLPVFEGFEGAFPPAGWTLNNPNANGTWVQQAPGRNSPLSAFIDNYTVAGLTGQIDELRTPFLNVAGADSVIVTFDVAHRPYPGASDSLSVLTSGDCGNSFGYVYSKGGTGLATGATSTGAFTAPTAAEWRNERIALGGSAIASGSLVVNFRNRNAYGNNIFIDNVNITGLFKRDLRLVSVNGLSSLICAATVTPSVTVQNVGSETVTGFKISYTINGGGLQTVTVTGISLPRNAQTTVNLPVINTATPGVYRLQVYSLEPITASGTGDLITINDTLVRTYSVPGPATAPLVESFTGTAFPPANWGIGNPDNDVTWQRSNTGNGNAGSAYVNTFSYNTMGAKDDLATPILSFGSFDSARLSFDLAAATFNYPGSTAVPLDTLEVLITRDCGATFTTVYKKWGTDLQTVSDPNSPQTAEFTPFAANQWRRETIDLTNVSANRSPLQFVFRVTNNSENNIFIDNVNFGTQTLPSLLKQQGYLISPTAFQNSFRIWHLTPPSNLKYVRIINAAGQLVWMKQFGGNADRQMSVDLTGKPAGVYFVEVGYTDANRNVTQRVVKY